MRRSLGTALVTAVVLGGLALGVVGLRVQQVRLGYQLDALRDERAEAETLLQRLEIEVASLRSPLRIEQRARQLGLTVPAHDQVRLAREYVTGTTGLAAAHRNRVAAVNDGIVR